MNSTPARHLLTELDYTVRTYDIDFAGHVSNQVYIRWLEDLRFALLEQYLPLKPLMDAGTVPLVTETRIKYRKPIQLFEAVHGVMWIEKLEAVRITLVAEITVDGEIRAEATQLGAFVRTVTGLPMRPPETLRRMITPDSQR